MVIDWIDAMSWIRIAWGFGMSAYQNSGMSRLQRLYGYEAFRSLFKFKRCLPEEGAKGLVAIQALYYLDIPEFC